MIDNDYHGIGNYWGSEQPQEELQQDVERVVELACRHLSPGDQDLLRWATGLSVPNRREAWREMAVVGE